MIFVFNKRTYNGEGEYIGRPSILGNPYSHKDGTKAEFKVGSRDEAIEKFAVWIRGKLESDNAVSREIERLVEEYRKEGHLTLICWCSPYACHGNVLAEIIKERANA